MKRYSDATKLKNARFLAKEGGCFVVERTEKVRVLGAGRAMMIDRIYWLLYRMAEPRNQYIGKRTNIDGLLTLVKKATATK